MLQSFIRTLNRNMTELDALNLSAKLLHNQVATQYQENKFVF